MSRRLMTHLSTAIVSLLILAACSTGSDDAATDIGSAQIDDNPSDADQSAASDDEGEQRALTLEIDSEFIEVSDDNLLTFSVSDAGEVDIQFEDMELVLVEIRPADGWDYDVDEQDSDEIEIEFAQQGREIELEVEIENGVLEIEIEEEWDDAEPGTYRVGDAGEVEFDWDGERLTLVDVRPAEGWDYVIDDEEDDEIEVEFHRGSDEAEFEVEVDDGQLELEIETELHFEINS